MKKKMRTLSSMMFSLALGAAFYLTAPLAHADDVATSPQSPTDSPVENSLASAAAQESSAASQVPANLQAQENSSSDVRLESSGQQTSVNPDASTEMQDPAEQTPPAEDSEAQAETKPSGPVRATSAQTVHTRSILASQVGNAISDLSTDKASYRPGEPVNLSVDFTNTTDKEQDITVHADVYYLENQIGSYQLTKHLAAGASYQMQKGDLVLPASQFANDHAYLIKIRVADSQGQTLGQVNRAVAYETDWTKFPRYGIVGGSQDKNNSLLAEDLDNKYRPALEKMKNMNINSYFFYDVYKSATNPFPNEASFEQKWNTWSHSKIDTQAVKAIVDQVHEGGAVAMLYNMILAEQADEAPVLPETEYAYNSDNRGYGEKGQPMTYSIDGKPLQRYYNPRSKQWQDFIASRMEEAMKNGGFDGWQGDTIGDNQVYNYADKDSNDESKRFWLTEGYAEFLNAIKEKLPNYYLTLNDVNGEQIYRLGSAKQDVIYNEIWPFGGSALGNGRQQTEYGDLKARVDEVRKVTGKSLIVGAYMEEGNNTKDGKPNGARKDAQDQGYFQKDAVLLTTATIAASGGYHMSLAAIGNDKDDENIGVLQTAYYPTQDLRVSSELNRKNNDYQQFITAYENILRDHVENDTTGTVKTYNAQGQLLSTDDSGINGHQVWTFGKKGDNFRTVQLLNLMGINSDWKNEGGSSDNKTPEEQTNLTVKYALGDVSMEEAQRMADQTYVLSPDDWSKSNMLKVAAQVETDENGHPVLAITVPKLELWDVIYISSSQGQTGPETEAPTHEQETQPEVAPKPEEPQVSPETDQPANPGEAAPEVPNTSETPSTPSEPQAEDTPAQPSQPETPVQPENSGQRPEDGETQPAAPSPAPDADGQATNPSQPSGSNTDAPSSDKEEVSPSQPSSPSGDSPVAPSTPTEPQAENTPAQPSQPETPVQPENSGQRPESGEAQPAVPSPAPDADGQATNPSQPSGSNTDAPAPGKEEVSPSQPSSPSEDSPVAPSTPAEPQAENTPAQPAQPETPVQPDNSGQRPEGGEGQPAAPSPAPDADGQATNPSQPSGSNTDAPAPGKEEVSPSQPSSPSEDSPVAPSTPTEPQAEDTPAQPENSGQTPEGSDTQPATPDSDAPADSESGDKPEGAESAQPTDPAQPSEEEGTDVPAPLEPTDPSALEILPAPSKDELLPLPQVGEEAAKKAPAERPAIKEALEGDSMVKAGGEAKASSRADDSRMESSNPMISSHTGQPMSPQLPAASEGKLVADGKKVIAKEQHKEHQAKSNTTKIGLVIALCLGAGAGIGLLAAKRKKADQ